METEIQNSFVDEIETNPQYFLDLITKYSYRLVRTFSYLHLQDINDISQNIFLKLYKYRNKFDPSKYTGAKDPVRNWVFSITHNEIINYLTKDYNRISPLEPYLYDNEEGISENKNIINMSIDIFRQTSCDQEKELIINELLDYMTDNLNTLQIDILKCYLNPPKKLVTCARKLNGDGSKIIQDKAIIKFLNITPQRLITAKAKFFSLIHRWLDLQ